MLLSTLILTDQSKGRVQICFLGDYTGAGKSRFTVVSTRNNLFLCRYYLLIIVLFTIITNLLLLTLVYLFAAYFAGKSFILTDVVL